MYELERLAQDVFFEVLDQLGDSVGIGPCFAAVVAGPESVGVVCLIDKGAVGFNEFLYRRPETAGKRGEDGFVDEPFLGGVIGIVINCEQLIEGFNQFGRFGGIEVGRCRKPLFLGFLLFLLVSGRRLGAESLSLAVLRRERRERRPQQPAGVGQPERLCQLGLGKGLEAWDELLLPAVGERGEAIAAADREARQALLNHQILITAIP